MLSRLIVNTTARWRHGAIFTRQLSSTKTMKEKKEVHPDTVQRVTEKPFLRKPVIEQDNKFGNDFKKRTLRYTLMTLGVAVIGHLIFKQQQAANREKIIRAARGER